MHLHNGCTALGIRIAVSYVKGVRPPPGAHPVYIVVRCLSRQTRVQAHHPRHQAATSAFSKYARLLAMTRRSGFT